MDILFLLIPLSVVLVLFIIAGLWWAIYTGQFEDTEAEFIRRLHELGLPVVASRRRTFGALEEVHARTPARGAAAA